MSLMPLVELPRSGRPVKPRLFHQVEAVERLVRHLHRPGSRGLDVRVGDGDR
jgi:hypothetical protein